MTAPIRCSQTTARGERCEHVATWREETRGGECKTYCTRHANILSTVAPRRRADCPMTTPTQDIPAPAWRDARAELLSLYAYDLENDGAE